MKRSPTDRCMSCRATLCVRPSSSTSTTSRDSVLTREAWPPLRGGQVLLAGSAHTGQSALVAGLRRGGVGPAVAGSLGAVCPKRTLSARGHGDPVAGLHREKG